MRYIDVEYPAWVIVGYPRYVPEILDMVTMNEVLYNLFVREFADDTRPVRHDRHVSTIRKSIDFRNDADALRQWKDRPAHLESGVQAVVLSRHLADPVPARPVPLPVQRARPVELSARPGAARPVRSRPASRSCRKHTGGGRPRRPNARPRVHAPNGGIRQRGADLLRRAFAKMTTTSGSTIPTGRCGSFLFGLLRTPGEENSSRSRPIRPEHRIAADAAAVRRQPADQHGAGEIPAAHRLSAVHPQAMGGRLLHQRDRRGLARARPTIRAALSDRRCRPGAGSIAAC